MPPVSLPVSHGPGPRKIAPAIALPPVNTLSANATTKRKLRTIASPSRCVTEGR